MHAFFQFFVKLTGWLVQALCFRTKVYYEDKKTQSRRIKGAAIVMSNHTSVYDFAVMLFVFPFRTLRYLMAELLFRRKGLGTFLRMMGGVMVNRDSYDFAFLEKSREILEKGGVIGVFPESRLPLEGEERLLPFKPSTAYLAMMSGAPIIPVYTNGSYFKKKRARVIIGNPIDVRALIDESLSEKENIEKITEHLRKKVIELEYELKSKLKSKS